MSLTLTPSFAHQPNLVLPLAPNGFSSPVTSGSGLAVRVASQQSGTLGTLTASSFVATPTWQIVNAPSWVTISTAGSVTTINFTTATFQATPYEFYIQATDGVTTVQYPIFLEVKTPLSLVLTPASNSNLTVSGTTITATSFDSTVADVIINPQGLFGNPATGVNFLFQGQTSPAAPLNALVPGLLWITSAQTDFALRVTDPSFSNLAGGISLFTGSPAQVSIPIGAYQAGSFYDEPDRTFNTTLTYKSTALKSGTLDVGINVYTDPSTGDIHFNVEAHYLKGQPSPILTYQWTITTTSGTVSYITGSPSGSLTTPTSPSVVVAVSGAASATPMTANLEILSNATPVGLFSVPNFNVYNAGAWTGTNAVKIGLAATIEQGWIGDTLNATFSTPASELAGGEVITLTFTVSNGSGLEPTITPPASVQLSSGTPTQNVSLTFPTGALIGYKWMLNAAAVSSVTPRIGGAQALFMSNGAAPLEIVTTGNVPPSSTILSNTGSSITPVPLFALNNDPNSPNYLDPVTPVLYELVGAPDGLFIQQVGSNFQLAGNALQAGSYPFLISATSSGFQRSYTSTITLTVSTVAVPLTVSGVAANVSSIPDNSLFTISWGGNGTYATSLDLIQLPSATPIYNVEGKTSFNLTQVGTCVYDVYGTSFYGTAYGVPIVVISSSASTLGQFKSAPTVGLIDQNNNLTLNWQPFTGPDGTYDQYDGWNITLVNPPSAPTITFKPASLNAGETESNRIYSTVLGSGTYLVNMQALSNDLTAVQNSNLWEFNGSVTNLQFPAPIQTNQVSFDNTTVLLGQTVTITLSATYTGAAQWQVIYPDNTTTGWLPLSSSVVAKQFEISGSLNIIVQTRYTYTTSAYAPPVVLVRQNSFTLFVMDQQFNPQAAAQSSLTGTLGISGEQGFEIVDATSGTVTPNPWLMVARGIVRDTLTNELKLIIADSRFANASSLLGTQAMDVFPILGRPKNLELIVPSYENAVTATTSSVPVKITTTTLPNFVVGKPISPEFQLVATGGTSPYAWYTDGMPPGMRLSVNGIIAGTPLELGVFSVNFASQDSSTPFYVAETTLDLLVETDLLIATTALPNATVGTAYNFQMVLGNAVGGSSVGGLPPYTWAIAAGALPIGITINPQTGLLTGVPCTYNSTTDFQAINPGKVFTATIQVTDAIGAKASATYSIQLFPQALTLGLAGQVDQPTIFADDDFKLVVPVSGGYSPYTFVNFSDDGVVGSGLEVVNPISISVVNHATTTIELTGIGGVPPYTSVRVIPPDPPFNTTFIPAGGAVTPQTMPNQYVIDATNGGSGVAPGIYTVHFELIDNAVPNNVFNSVINVTVVNPAVFTILTQNQEYGAPYVAVPPAFQSSYTYLIGDAVTEGSNSYIAIAQSVGQAPPNVNFWVPYTNQTIVPLTATGPNPVATWAINPNTTTMPSVSIGTTSGVSYLIFNFPGFGSWTVGVQATDTLGNTTTTTLLFTVLQSRPFQLADGQIEIMVNPTVMQVGTHTFSVTVRDSNPISPTTLTTQFNYTAASEIAVVGIGAGSEAETAYFDHYWIENDDTTVTLPITPPGAGYSLGTFVPPTLGNGLTVSVDDTNPLAPNVSLAGPPTAFQNSEFYIPLPIIQGVQPAATLTRQYTSVAHNDLGVTGDLGTVSIQSRPYLVGQAVGFNPVKPWFNSANFFKNINWTARVQKASSLPSGLSLDANTSLIYGTLAGVFAAPAISVIEYVDSSGTIHGTVTINWDTQQSAFALTTSNLVAGQILQQYGGVPQGLAIPTTSQTPIVSVNTYRGRLPAGLALSFDSSTPPNLFISGTPTEAGYFDIWLSASNSGGQSAYAYYRFVVDYINPLTIVTTSLPSIVSNIAYSYLLSGTGGVPPYTWALDGTSPALPTSITLASDGLLSGTTAQGTGSPGVWYNQNIIVDLTDSEGSTTQASINLQGNNTLRIVNMPPLPAVIPGQPYFYEVQAEGGIPFTGPNGPYTWALTVGTTPTGISFNTINGSPVACVPGGSFSGVTSLTSFSNVVTVKVTDNATPTPNTATASATLQVGVASGMLINTSGVGVINRGTPYLGTLAAAGTFVAPTNASTAITWQVILASCSYNQLPAGLSLVANASNFGLTAAIVGTYSGAPLVNYPVEILATDSAGHTAVVILDLNTGTNLAVTTTALPTGEVGGSYPPPSGGGYQLTASGGVAPYTWSITNPTPPVDGLSITSGGLLQGSPTAVYNNNVTFQVSDSLTPPNTATATLNLTVQSTTLAISAPYTLSVTSGRAYTTTLAATGGFTPYTWSIVSGNLPTGLSLTSAGVISGTTSVNGSSTVTIKVTDNTGAHVQQVFTVNVVSGLTLQTGIDYVGSTAFGYLGYIDKGNVTSITLRPNDSFYVVATGVVSTSPSQLTITVSGSFVVGTVTLSSGVAVIPITGPFSTGSAGNNNLSISVTDSGVTANATFKWYIYGDGTLRLVPTSGSIPTKLTTPT